MTTLTDKAMLVRVSVHQWTGRKMDKQASEEVCEINNAAADAGRFNKLLLDKDQLAGVAAAVNAIRKHADKQTLPWTIAGVCLLPAANYFDFMAEHGRLVRALEDERSRLVARYDAAKEARKAKLGDLYREADYPAAETLHASIRSEIDVMPLPDAADFRVTLGDAEEARIRDEITASVNAAVAGAVRSLWDRVHETVSAMHKRLTLFKPGADGGKVEHPFRDSLVTNMRELVALLAKLNITEDTHLERVRRDLEENLCFNEPEDLRSDDNLRAKQAAECEKILKEMSFYIGDVPLAA